MNCPEAIDLMGDVIDGSLPPASQAGFEEHMAECPSCRTYLEHLHLTRQALRSLPRDSRADSRMIELLKKFTEEFDR